VNVPAAAGDWFGGWDGDEPSRGHLYADAEARTGRMVELIERGGPAVMYCHWPGLYTQGTKEGYRDFQRVVTALHGRFGDTTAWMKLSELARYWTARELTTMTRAADEVRLDAPFACPAFTLRMVSKPSGPPSIRHDGERVALREVPERRRLAPGTWLRDGDRLTACFDLAKGTTTLVFASGQDHDPGPRAVF
jgi:hypothetical protein